MQPGVATLTTNNQTSPPVNNSVNGNAIHNLMKGPITGSNGTDTNGTGNIIDEVCSFYE